MARFELEDEDIDFGKVKDAVPSGSMRAGVQSQDPVTLPVHEDKAVPAPAEEKKEEAAPAPVAEVEKPADKPAQVKETTKKVQPKKEKAANKSKKKAEPEEVKVVEQAPVQEQSAETETETEKKPKEFPSLSHIINHNDRSLERVVITTTLDEVNNERLTRLLNMIPGKSRAKGQIICNLLDYFFEVYAEDIKILEQVNKLKL